MANLTRPITLPLTYPLTQPLTGAWRRSSTPGFSLTAPVLTLLTGATDNTPLFGFSLTNPLADDVIRLEWDDAIPYSAQAGTADYTITAGDLSGDFEFDFSLSPFANGPYSWRAYHRRGGNSSSVSNTVTETIAATVFSLTITDHKENSAGGTTITYNSGGDPSIGATDAARYVVIGVTFRSNVTGSSPTSVTVGGVSCTAVAGTRAVNNNATVSEFWITDSAIASGTTAEVVIVYPTSAQRSGVVVARLVTTTPAVSSANASQSTSANSLNHSITVPVGGGGISMFGQRDNVSTGVMTWTNATESFEATYGSGIASYTAANVSIEGAVSVTAANNVTNNEVVMSSAAWAA